MRELGISRDEPCQREPGSFAGGGEEIDAGEEESAVIAAKQDRLPVIRTAKVPQTTEEPRRHQHHQRQPDPHARRVDDEVHHRQRKQHALRDDGKPGERARPWLVYHGWKRGSVA